MKSHHHYLDKTQFEYVLSLDIIADYPYEQEVIRQRHLKASGELSDTVNTIKFHQSQQGVFNFWDGVPDTQLDQNVEAQWVS